MTYKYYMMKNKLNDRKEIDMIELAIAYAAAHGSTDEAKNDAANIYSSNYDEYMKIWVALTSIQAADKSGGLCGC